MSTPPELRFHLEWQTYPTWVAVPGGGSDNPDPHDLGIPGDLADAIVVYSDDYDALWDAGDPRAPRFADRAAELAFYDRGRALADRLAGAVGTRWRVRWQDADGTYVDLSASGG